jgi:glycerophosphoryl diester phosphodiesterase
MLLLGHRGCRGKFIENTFEAFDHALASGCDGFEFDVRRSADCIPVVWHDARVRGRAISRHSFASLQERCARGQRLPPRAAIPLCDLEALLARYAQLAWMDIELKVRGVEEQVAELLRRYPPARGFVVSSFQRRVLLELHRIDPGVPLGLIFDRMPSARVWRALPIQWVMPKAHLVTAARVRQFHEQGLNVLTWTVNRPNAMRRMAEAGVDGMIGDDPALLCPGKPISGLPGTPLAQAR